jgi:plastocyanin
MKKALSTLPLAVAALALSLAGPAAAARYASGVTVFAGPPLQKPVVPHADALAFFPRAVTIRAGETVTWQLFGFHTVTFAGANQPYPFVVPSGSQPTTNDASGSPFWWSGKLPLLTVSPVTLLPQSGASISSPLQVRSSGLLRILTARPGHPPAPFALRFTQPGVYHYQCAVHPGMRGVVIVLQRSKSEPSPTIEAAAAKQALGRAIADQRRLAGTKPANPLRVLVGAGDNATGAEVTSFFPSQLSINVGDTVTFVNHDQTDIHTVTFGPEKLRSSIEKGFAAPHGRQVLLNALGALPSDPPGPAAQYDGSNHGNGYLNSGILQPQGAPASAGPKSFAVTFTRAGVYHYECVVHANMDGTIIVR